MKKYNRYIPFALFLGFLFISLAFFIDAKPTQKSKRVYKIVREYSPYYFEKRFGGLTILDKRDKEFKEKIDNAKVFKRFEELERNWGKSHLRVNKDSVTILNDNNKSVKEFKLKDKKEREFIRNYYGV